MEIWILPALLALFIAMCSYGGIWLLLHLTAVAAMFRGKADIVPAPSPPRASRAAVSLALALFIGGLTGAIGTQVAAILI